MFKRTTICLSLTTMLAGCNASSYLPGVTITQPTPAIYAPATVVVSNPLIHPTQVELIRLGYLHDNADGVLGPRTSNAISDFQQANGLDVNGSPSYSLLARLRSTSNVTVAVQPDPVQVAPVPTHQEGWVSPTTSPDQSHNTGWVTPKQ
jgi:peptidoglycan hydrolase-like protein with peptidoglycan-binding domain